MKSKRKTERLVGLYLAILLLAVPLSVGIAQEDVIELELFNGRIYLYADPSSIDWNDLSWLRFQLVPTIATAPQPGEGIFISGRLTDDIIKGKAFIRFEQGLEVPFSGGTLNLFHEEDLLVKFNDNSFSLPQLANLYSEMKLGEDEEAAINLIGLVQQGKYKDMRFSIKLKLQNIQK